MFDDAEKRMIIEAVVQRLQEKLVDKTLCEKKTSYTDTCIIIAPNICGSDVMHLAKKMYSQYKILFIHDGHGTKCAFDEWQDINIDVEGMKVSVMDAMCSAKVICCIDPLLNLMEMISDGNDADFYAGIIIKSVLMSKKTEIITGFDCNIKGKGRFFKKLWGIVEDLKCMGINIVGLKPDVCNEIQSINSKGLITENEILSTLGKGYKTIECSKNSIITPLAVDTAREKGVNIIKK